MIVLDCSAAVEIARNTERGNTLRSLICPDETIIAPSWFRIELRNAFWKYIHSKMLSKDEALRSIALVEMIVDEFIAPEDLLIESFSEAVAYDHSVYDMIYLCLARRYDATVFTVDKKLIEVCIQAKVNCIEEVGL